MFEVLYFFALYHELKVVMSALPPESIRKNHGFPGKSTMV